MTRGVLYVIWGDRAQSRVHASIASLKRFHPDLPIHIHELTVPGTGEFDHYRGLLEKAKMNDWTPFDQTLYLDADTTIMGNLDFGFQQAQRHGIACAHCECPWARRYRAIPQRPDTVEYSTGVLFWSREKSSHIFDEWKRITPLVDTTILFTRDGTVLKAPYGDQGSFCATLEALHFNPFVLPLNWNFRPQFYTTFFGPLKIWHDYAEPPQPFLDLNTQYENPAFLIAHHTINWNR